MGKWKKKSGKIISCDLCNEEFYISPSRLASGRGKYCSKKCYSQAVACFIKCLQCGQTKKIKKSSNQKFCSDICRAKAVGKKLQNGNTIQCKNCHQEFYKSLIHTQNKNVQYCSKKCYYNNQYYLFVCSWCGNINKSIKSVQPKFCSKSCSTRHRLFIQYLDFQSKDQKRKYALKHPSGFMLKPRASGENHYKYKGLPRRDRATAQYNQWRRNVFERDNYTCQLCNYRGGQLNAHHIKPWRSHISLRFKINNGQTLCVQCHSKVDKYATQKYIHPIDLVKGIINEV